MAFQTIQGTGASDATSFVGTSGVDTINIGAGTSGAIFLGARQANDIIGISAGGTRSGYTLQGGQGLDTFTSSGTVLSNSLIEGGGAADSFGTTSAGFNISNSTLQGNDGRDTIFLASATGSKINGNQGLDIITALGTISDSEVRGGSENDTIVIGNNSLINTLVQGDAGSDSISIAANASSGKQVTNSTINGGAGSDTLNGAEASAALLLAGGDDADTIAGSTGADTINGGTGNDSIQGNAGADNLAGGDGDDQFVYAASNQLFSAGVLIDNIVGGTGANAIAINNNLVGNNGNTTFTIASTDSFATRFSGVQTIRAYGATNQSINIDLIATAFASGIRNLDLSADTDATANNRLDASLLVGAGEGLTMTGSAGIDSINGGSGTDTISGGGQNDTITGAAGADNLTGGLGVDRFVYTTNASTDQITDFALGGAGDNLAVSVAGLAPLGLGGAANAAGTAFTITRLGAAGNTGAAAQNIYVLEGATFANLAAAEAAIEGGTRALTNNSGAATAAAGNIFFVVWADAAGNSHFSSYGAAAAVANAAGFAAGSGTLSDLAVLQGVDVSVANSFNAANIAALVA